LYYEKNIIRKKPWRHFWSPARKGNTFHWFFVTFRKGSNEEELFRLALSLADRLQPLNESEINSVKQKTLEADPIFRSNG
jgi:hypothetical protein